MMKIIFFKKLKIKTLKNSKWYKNVRNPHILHTLPHILRTLEILQFFEFF